MKIADVPRSALDCGGMPLLSKFRMAKAAPWPSPYTDSDTANKTLWNKPILDADERRRSFSRRCMGGKGSARGFAPSQSACVSVLLRSDILCLFAAGAVPRRGVQSAKMRVRIRPWRTRMHEKFMPLWLAIAGVGIALVIAFLGLRGPIGTPIAPPIPNSRAFCPCFGDTGQNLEIKRLAGL